MSAPPEAPAATATSPSVSITDHVLGIDLGSDTSIVAKANTRSLKAEILRNDLSNQKTPMVISFAGGHRSYGEVASQLKTTNRDLSVEGLLPYLDHCFETQEDQAGFQPFLGVFEDDDETKKLLKVSLSGEEMKFRSDQLMGMMLKKLASFGQTKMQPQEEKNEGENTGEENQGDAETGNEKQQQQQQQLPVAIVFPDSFNESQKQALMNAAIIAGIQQPELVSRCEAAIMDYGHKRAAETLNGTVTMIVDIGHNYSSATIVEFGEDKKCKIVAKKCLSGVGGYSIDKTLFDSLSKKCEEEKNTKISAKGKIRLLTQVRKLKESLSAVPEANITCESLVEDQDVKFNFKRDELESICSKINDQVGDLVQSVLAECSEQVKEKLKACELIGGGMRVPMIKEAIQKAVGEHVSLNFTMDSMAAVVCGACVVCASRVYDKFGSGGVSRPAYDNVVKFEDSSEEGEKEKIGSSMSPEVLESAMQQEEKLDEIDAKIEALHAANNKLEARVFEIRSLAQSSAPHTDLIDKPKVLAIIDVFENWFYDYEEGGGANENVTLEDFESKLQDLEEQLKEPLEAYNKKVLEEKLKTEAEMEKQAAQAAAELEASGGKEDHDNRKLKKPERMRKVMLNKEEGNTLFKDGNFGAASLRYVRALQHCEKFFDLSPEDEKEVDSVKLSLHLNQSQCFLKQKKWKEASESAKLALEIDQDSTKALYRLAFALENLKEFAEAKKLLNKASQLAPEDKSISKLSLRCDAQILREKQKRKAMAKKMFG